MSDSSITRDLKLVKFEEIIKNTKSLLKEGKVFEALKSSNGWKTGCEVVKVDDYREIKNEINRLHDKIENDFFNYCYSQLDKKDRKKILTKFSHKTHFLEGVSKSYAIEHYIQSPDFKLDIKKKKFTSIFYAQVILTDAMLNYCKIIEDTRKNYKG